MAKKSTGITLAELAADLKLTSGTVSRALNGYPDIAKATREKVAIRAAQLNYSPSASAKRLATGVVNTIGLVLPKMSSTISDSFFVKFLEGAAAEFAKTDRDILLTTVQSHETEVEVYHRLWRTRKVDGFIVVRTRSDDERINFLLQNNIPFVSHGRSDNAQQYPWYDADNQQAMEGAVEHLANLGHKNIAYIGGANNYHFSKLRLAGFNAGLVTQNLELNQPIFSGPLSEAFGYQCIQQILAQYPSVSAVICAQDKLALGVYRGLYQASLQPGRDISVLGYDDISASAYVNPPLSTMAPEQHLSGAICAELFVSHFEKTDIAELQRIAPVRFIKRHSTATLPNHFR